MKEVFKLLGLNGMCENFFVFLVFGVLVTAVIGMEYGLNAKLPEDAADFIKEPISLNTFFFLTLFGFLSSAIAAFTRGQQTLQSNIIKRGALATSRVGLSAGSAICGTFIGISVTFYLASLIKDNQKWAETSGHYFALSIVFAFYIAFMMLSHLYLFLPWDKKYRSLDLASVIFLTLVNGAILLTQPALSYVLMGAQFSIILIAFISYKKINRLRHERASTH